VPVPSRVSDADLMGVQVFYLHGFASSSKSTKAAFFDEQLRAYGIRLHCPDFNQQDFAGLTMTRMLGQLETALAAAGHGPFALIGSSLGGTLAVLAAARLPSTVDRLVLLAPAVMFAKERHHLLPPERIDEWRRRGALPFFHYGDNTERLLKFAFYEDSLQYKSFDASFQQPALVFQGIHDQSVDPATVEAFARIRPNVTLTLLEDDHQLTASLPRMWTDIAPFLGLT
jgi:pimeloyl-ACP methyl ester carboxylesterase